MSLPSEPGEHSANVHNEETEWIDEHELTQIRTKQGRVVVLVTSTGTLLSPFKLSWFESEGNRGYPHVGGYYSEEGIRHFGYNKTIPPYFETGRRNLPFVKTLFDAENP